MDISQLISTNSLGYAPGYSFIKELDRQADNEGPKRASSPNRTQAESLAEINQFRDLSLPSIAGPWRNAQTIDEKDRNQNLQTYMQAAINTRKLNSAFKEIYQASKEMSESLSNAHFEFLGKKDGFFFYRKKSNKRIHIDNSPINRIKDAGNLIFASVGNAIEKDELPKYAFKPVKSGAIERMVFGDFRYSVMEFNFEGRNIGSNLLHLQDPSHLIKTELLKTRKKS